MQFRSPSRWLWALVLSVLLHGAWLAASAPRDGLVAGPKTPALDVRTIAAAAPPPAPRPLPTTRPRAKAKPAEVPAELLTPKLDVIDVRIPPAVDWLYTLRQNGRSGTARLRWEPLDDGRYRLMLTRELDGRALPGWRSEGTLDAQGLAPQRYATQRSGRDAQATNFRRDEGLISFSASTAETALVAGVQDRLSWCVQLAARVAALASPAPGDTIALSVVGLRGEPMRWEFEVIEVGPAALHLRRAALGPYDGAIDTWLDPAQGHLPIRLAVRWADEQGYELERAAPEEQPLR